MMRPKTDDPPPLPRLVPIGYSVPTVQRRATRPLHSRPSELRATAEAAFKGEINNAKQPIEEAKTAN